MGIISSVRVMKINFICNRKHDLKVSRWNVIMLKCKKKREVYTPCSHNCGYKLGGDILKVQRSMLQQRNTDLMLGRALNMLTTVFVFMEIKQFKKFSSFSRHVILYDLRTFYRPPPATRNY